jgi:vacuolar-type H+-ATPase subunit D/Vma8
MGEVMKEAAFSLAEAKFATGDFNQVVLQNVTKAQIKIRTKKDNVAGICRLYTYKILTDTVADIYILQLYCGLYHQFSKAL